MSDAKQSIRPLVGSASMLLIGVVIGIAIDRVTVIHGHGGAHSPGVVVVASAEPDAAFSELAEHLDLSEQQAAQAQEIFSAHQASVDTAWTEVQDHLGLAIQSVMQELESVLEPGQLGRLHQWIAERHGALPVRGEGTSR